MINPEILRKTPELVRKSQLARGESPELVDEFVTQDTRWRSLTVKTDELKSEQKNLNKQIGPAKSANDSVALENLTKRGGEIASEIDRIAKDLEQAREKSEMALKGISNLIDDSAPVGGEADFEVIETHGAIKDFEALNLKVLDHVEIGKNLNMIDIERGAKVSGSRFYYLIGDGALLELALVNFAMDIAGEFDLTPVIPPALVRPPAMEGTGFLGQAAENVYRIEADDLYLVGTSEVPLAAMHMDEILNPNELPIRYAGYSPCYRREAGSHGRDTRGIFRVHWFDKVEMFVFTNPENALTEHQRLLEIEKTVLQRLEIPFRVIDVASGDMGSSAARKYDCEAWIPSMNEYRELTSTSNCTEYQSRRLKIRTRDENNKTQYVATLNGTLIAMTRTIVALLENHQNAEGGVDIPKALQPYLQNRSSFDPKK
ncbi:MAG: serine--tRNA ligase [Candidatus Nanopelagicales bacterium]